MSKKIMLFILVALVSVSSLFALSDDVFSQSFALGYNSRQPGHVFIGPAMEFDMLYPVKGRSISHGLGTRVNLLADLDYEYTDSADDTVLLLSSGYSMYWTNRDCRLECNLFVGPSFFMNNNAFNYMMNASYVKETDMMYGVGGCMAAGFTFYFNKASTFGLYGNVSVSGGAAFTPESILLDSFNTSFCTFATGSIGVKINYRGLMPWDR